MNFSRAANRARARVKLSVRNRRGLGSPRGAVKNATPAAAAEAAQPTRGTLPHAEVRKIFFGLMLAAFLAALNQTIIATALPTIGRYFGDFENLELDRHRVSADLDGGGAALRQAVRHLRPPRHDPDRDRSVHRGLGCGCRGARHDLVDHRPRPAGHRRRRHPAALPVGDRRRRGAPRARPLPSLHGRGLGDLRRVRPGGRRHAGRASALVADLLDQRAARPWAPRCSPTST